MKKCAWDVGSASNFASKAVSHCRQKNLLSQGYQRLFLSSLTSVMLAAFVDGCVLSLLSRFTNMLESLANRL